MNIELPKKKKMNIKLKIIYIVFAIICVVAIAIGVYMQFFTDAKLDVILGINKFYGASDDVYDNLEATFDSNFTNKLNSEIPTDIDITKIDNSIDLIFTEYENTDSVDGKYTLNVEIPYINIKTQAAVDYNKQIKDIFEEKVNSIIENSKINTVYTVEYSAYINNNILSLIIRSNLKEGSSAQRVIVQTYNYNLETNEEVKIADILELKGIDVNYADNKIEEKIKKVESQVEDLRDLGYSIFTRDYTSQMYKIDNATEFFLGQDGYLYVIYAYGNDNITSEMDMVIF